MTNHEYTGIASHDDEQSEHPVWVCTTCDEPQFASPPGEDNDDREVHEEFQDTRSQKINRKLNAYYERHGHYPWEG